MSPAALQQPLMKTLVVDDDLTSRLVLEDVMARFGQVDACADGDEAVRAGIAAITRGEPYDLICMDIMMPSMSGIEALQRIRNEEDRVRGKRVTRVIMVTGSEDSEFINQAFGRYCDAYIVKPIDAEALLGVIECLVPEWANTTADCEWPGGSLVP